MNKQELLQLEKMASMKPVEIETLNAGLFGKLTDSASLALKSKVESKLKDAPTEFVEALGRIDFSADKLGSLDVKMFLADSLQTIDVSDARKKELEVAVASIPTLGKIDTVLLPELPIFVNPLFQKDLEKARIYRLGDMTGISDVKVEKIFDSHITITGLEEEKLEGLVKDNIVTREEAGKLAVAAGIHSFVDGSFELAEVVSSKGNPGDLSELAKVGKEEWKSWIEDSGMALTEGLTSSDYADFLSRKAEQLFPEVSLVAKTTKVDAVDLVRNLNAVEPLTRNNKSLFGIQSFDDLDISGLQVSDLDLVKNEYEKINKLVKANPGLHLDKFLNDGTISDVDKGKFLIDRLGMVNKFLQQNKNVHFLSLEYKHDSEDLKLLNFDGFSVQEKNMIIGNIKAQQRILSFTDNVSDAQRIMEAGFHSSFHVTSVTLDQFIDATKIDKTLAEKYYLNAHMTIVKTTGVMGSVIDILTGSFDWTNVGNTGPSIHDYLRDIPGYQDLFGELAFCDCQHCQSIYSPGAYFVDLMQFVERYVGAKHFSGSKATHVLNLKTRRPDLWSLELSCENTSNLVPYLDIINEILTTYIASEAKKTGAFAGNLADPALVETFVFKNEIALEKSGAWKDSVYSFRQPVSLPLEAVQCYLVHFERTREDLAILLGKGQVEVSKAKLQLSEKQVELVTVANNNPSFLQRVYGINFTITGGKITPLDALLLLKPIGVDRDELGRLLKTRYITKNATEIINFQSGKKTSTSIQHDIERVTSLTYDALDRIHRFVRLWRTTDLEIEELDLLVGIAIDRSIANDISPALITSLGQWLSLREKFNFSVEELATCIHLLPIKSIRDNSKSFFDVLLNPSDVVLAEGAYPKPLVRFIHPTLAINRLSANSEFNSGRLKVALKCSDDELLTLIRELWKPLGIVSLTSATESDRGFLLTRENLSILSRHTILAAKLKLSFVDLFRLIALSADFPNGYIENIDQFEKCHELYQWWKQSGFLLDDLHYILGTGKVIDSSRYLSAAPLSTGIITKISDEKQLLFADTVFAYLDGITEDQSRRVISSNGNVIGLSPDGKNYWLKKEFNPSVAITVPAGITVPEIELRKVLLPFHAQYLIPFHLSDKLRLSEVSIKKMLQSLAINLDKDELTLELQNKTQPSVELSAIITKLLPLSILFKDKKFIDAAIQFVVDSKAVFSIVDLDKLNLTRIRYIQIYRDFIIIGQDGRSNVTDLNGAISTYTNAVQYQSASPGVLSRVLDLPVDLIAGLHTLSSANTNAIKALNFYKEVGSVCKHIGVSGNTLNKVVSTNFDVLNEARLDLLAAFRSKYKDERDRKEKLDPYQDKLRGIRRSSLTNYLLHSGFPQFTKQSDLYHYFLIDTELEGCSRTSKLVAATMSLQLYIHRILLNLEQDDLEPGTVGRVYVQPDDLPSDEWEWRRNYRVWEANRKVFLYPENYIEPDLRDDKTPLFKELESELLQKEINADNVLEAYARYMRGFDEVAHLKIAGSYHEKDERTATDALHLFGVTADDPGVYYYRRVENLYYSEKRDDRGVVWQPWEKINVQIPVRKVAPITYNGRLHVFWTRITTLSNSIFDENRSIFTGYSHKVSIEFTTLKLDGTWTPPQKLNLRNCYPFEGNGVIQDPLADRHEVDEFKEDLSEVLRSFPFFDFSKLTDSWRQLKTPRYALSAHYEPIDEYTLKGFLWDQVYPYVDSTGRLVLTGAGYQMRAFIDFYNLGVQQAGTTVSGFTNDPVREIHTVVKDQVWKILAFDNGVLYRASPRTIQFFDNYAYESLLVHSKQSDELLNRLWAKSTLDQAFDISKTSIASLGNGSSVQIVNGAFSDAIIDVNGDLLLLQGSPVQGNGFILKRIGTTLSKTLTRTLFTSGLDTALSIATQKALRELDAPISLISSIDDKVVNDKIDWKGAYGNYYREIYFHIPFLLANHLNSQGKYADAQKWYHYIFNPGATEVISFPAGATAAQKKKLEMDRNWQYLEFRQINVQTLRDQLNDKAAIEAYKKDPFNPHAIARLRMSAYQKCIVMKYIDNLLDWGDQLFTRDTMESVNEATLLYVVAREILGERPAQIGDCGESKVIPKNYETLQPLLNKGSEFMAELESYTYVKTPGRKYLTEYGKVKAKAEFIYANNEIMADYTDSNYHAVKAMTYNLSAKEYKELKSLRGKYFPETSIEPVDDAVTGKFVKGVTRALDWREESIYVKGSNVISSFGYSFIRHVSPVFCIPGNKDLLDYYNRVDDRLFKIRNCMNIQGQKRQLALFAPEIDPRLLVRAKAAGLSLDDILNASAGNLPPYRFAYILERAKVFVSTVQSFGLSLLSAMEKRDGEELTMIRMTQQQNILDMSLKSRELEIESAEEGVKTLNDRLESLNYQIEYYNGLMAENRNGWEWTQSITRHVAGHLKQQEAILGALAGILRLVPQIGAPTAMKYGGLEIGSSIAAIGQLGIGAQATRFEMMSASAGLEAGFDRRLDGWKHQKKLLEMEKKQTEKNLVASEIRRDILIEEKKTHQKTIEHNKDVMEYYGDKFSGLGLYTWLSSTMQRMYKEAYNNALAISRLAEQAFRYERDDSSFFIGTNGFDSSRAGLLAGEQLLMSLHSMERRYLETNYRKNEVDQAFSLTQINPAALLALKQNGTCQFNIPEIFFDLFYPGQYRRKIQSVRLTIPCVTGPYTNVSATLALMSSRIRMDAKMGNAELKDVPKSRTTVIATSTAQNDAGVFELNFRDDRYMPFEGAGAISTWKLDLPKSFRQFDYQTINDIIIHVSYTAEYDELFRDKVEAENQATEGTLINILKNNALARTISLRQEFSTDYHRLTGQPVNTDVLLRIQDKHFPLFLHGKPLQVSKASLILVTPPGQGVNGVKISINTAEQSGFARDAALGNFYAKDLGNLFNGGIIKDHTLRITASGDLAMVTPPPGPEPALDTEKILDMILYIEFKLA